MPLHEFWYGDIRLLNVYQKAYRRNASYTAWLNGYNAFVAHSLALGNMWETNKSKKQDYPQWKDPIEQIDKPKITADNIEEQHRNLQRRQTAFIASIVNNKGSK